MTGCSLAVLHLLARCKQWNVNGSEKDDEIENQKRLLNWGSPCSKSKGLREALFAQSLLTAGLGVFVAKRHRCPVLGLLIARCQLVGGQQAFKLRNDPTKMIL